MKVFALFSIIAMSFLAGCASAPRKILVKNCIAEGSNLYNCEEISTKDIRTGRMSY